MDTSEIAELLGKAILLLNDNRSKAQTKMLLRLGNYDDEQIKAVFEYIDGLNLPT